MITHLSQIYGAQEAFMVPLFQAVIIGGAQLAHMFPTN